MRTTALSTLLAAALGVAVALPRLAAAQDFDYNPPGTLVPGSGTGRVDTHVYAPGMRFPIEQAPVYANSQVWGNGGMNGGGGSQCDAENYAYPWFDNFCETRSWDTPLCPSGNGHQGQDIRPRSCQDNTHWAVAATDGTVVSIGSYTLYMQDAEGTVYAYLHMEPTSILVDVGDDVDRGERLGRISDAFGSSSTTIHLHFEIWQVLEGYPDGTAVPPYMSLVESYEELLGQPGCGELGPEGGIIDNADSCFILHGPSATWRYVSTTGYDGDLYWSYTWENAASNWAEWLFEVAESGEYVVDVYITPQYAQSQDTRYSVLSGDEVIDLRLDQSSGDGWLNLGTFPFEAGTQQRVAVYDGPGEAGALQRQFVADAIRITPVGGPAEPQPEPSPDPSPGPDPEPDVGSPDVGADMAPDLPETPDLSEGDGTPVVPDAGGSDETGTPAEQPREEDPVTVNSGCGCTAAAGEPAALLPGLMLLALLVLRRRR